MTRKVDSAYTLFFESIVIIFLLKGSLHQLDKETINGINERKKIIVVFIGLNIPLNAENITKKIVADKTENINNL